MGSERKAANRVADQREQAIKYEINHDEKFREMYEDRLQKNRQHAETALPDERIADDELIRFDQARERHFREAENREQATFVRTKETDNDRRNHLDVAISDLEGRIEKLNAEIKNVESQSEFKIAQLQHEEEGLQNQIRGDVHLDREREDREKKEAREADGDHLF